MSVSSLGRICGVDTLIQRSRFEIHTVRLIGLKDRNGGTEAVVLGHRVTLLALTDRQQLETLSSGGKHKESRRVQSLFF